jgi:hypothetical protein
MNLPACGSLWTINRCPVTSRTQYSTMWARAYRAALTVRSKVKVVRYLDHQIQVFGPRRRRSKIRKTSLQHNQVGYRLIRRIVFRSHVDRRVQIHKTDSENLHRPAHQQRCGVYVSRRLAFSVDQVAFDQLEVLLIEQPCRLDSRTLCSGELFSRRGRRSWHIQHDISEVQLQIVLELSPRDSALLRQHSAKRRRSDTQHRIGAFERVAHVVGLHLELQSKSFCDLEELR